MKTFPQNVGFRTGALRSREVAYILAEDEALVELDQAHTVVLTWYKGAWYKHILGWVAKSACVLRSPKEKLLAISGAGEYLVFGQGEITEGQIVHLPTQSGRPGPFRSVSVIQDLAYAVGLGGVVMKRTTNGDWQPAEHSLPHDIDLEAIDGFSDEEIYAVGWSGQIASYNGSRWSPQTSPTNVILTGVVCAGDGSVYCVGQGGVILKGRHDKWQEVEQTLTEGDFWDVRWFDSKVWISTQSSLYVLEGDALKQVRFGDDYPSTTYRLSAADGELWSIGRKDIMANDGTLWRRIE